MKKKPAHKDLMAEMLYTLTDMVQCENIIMRHLPENLSKLQLKSIFNKMKEIIKKAQG